ncbi:hypothetical protein J1N35_029217, partial [Gossypium stocksii]
LGEGRSYSGSSKGKGHEDLIKFGFNLIKGKVNHFMEDYHLEEFWVDPSRAISKAFKKISKVMSNQEAIDIAKKFKDPQKALKQLIVEGVKRDSKDDIFCCR